MAETGITEVFKSVASVFGIAPDPNKKAPPPPFNVPFTPKLFGEFKNCERLQELVAATVPAVTPDAKPETKTAQKGAPVPTGPVFSVGAKDVEGDQSIKMIQLALYSLPQANQPDKGYVTDRKFVDGKYGKGMQEAVRKFQVDQIEKFKQQGYTLPIKPNGVLDQPTLRLLDAASMENIERIKTEQQQQADAAKEEPRLQKNKQYRFVVDNVSANKARLYVIGLDDKIVARYLVSPGTGDASAPGENDHPTKGTNFRIFRSVSKAWWVPPCAKWAEDLQAEPPGIENAMGIHKMMLFDTDLGVGTDQAFHGIPSFTKDGKPTGKTELLGKRASKGCIRMSGSNILHFAEHFAASGKNGSEVYVIQPDLKDDPAKPNQNESKKLEAQFKAQKLKDVSVNQGFEYLLGFALGKLGNPAPELAEAPVVPPCEVKPENPELVPGFSSTVLGPPAPSTFGPKAAMNVWKQRT